MSNEYLLSLVIPTNGVKEWVLPVLKSIYSQKVDERLFEVVVTDNGDSDEFYELMQNYCLVHSNFIYNRTKSKLFLNQIDGFKLANGRLIKFVNHRFKLKPGALEYLIDFSRKNFTSSPITYFLNGATDVAEKKYIISSFDSFMYGLKNYSSWSGGICCWKKDLEKILSNDTISNLFPHIVFITYYDSNRIYKIDNEPLFEEIPSGAKKKGNYDLFYAFGVEYVELIKELKNQELIDSITETFILKENEKFLAKMYLFYIVMKKESSYNFETVDTSLNRYYSLLRIRVLAYLEAVGVVWKKFLRNKKHEKK